MENPSSLHWQALQAAWGAAEAAMALQVALVQAAQAAVAAKAAHSQILMNRQQDTPPQTGEKKICHKTPETLSLNTPSHANS